MGRTDRELINQLRLEFNALVEILASKQSVNDKKRFIRKIMPQSDNDDIDKEISRGRIPGYSDIEHLETLIEYRDFHLSMWEKKYDEWEIHRQQALLLAWAIKQLEVRADGKKRRTRGKTDGN